MRILKVIFCEGKSSGGHYHSCDQLSRAIAKEVSVKIVSIGPVQSPIISNNPCFLSHIQYKKSSDLFRVNTAFKKLRKDYNPQLIHCYDTGSLNLLLLLPSLWNLKFVFTKCGGRNPIRNSWQYANSMINFSYENFQWFRERRSYRNVKLHLVPNRVNALEFLSDHLRKEQKDEQYFTFVRITRIDKSYQKTLLDSYNLIQKLLSENLKVRLLVIGRINNEERFGFFKEVAQERNLPVSFITDERTSKASDFLYLADCVIGTGRSLMEASSLGIPVLTPVDNFSMPILVNEDNFLGFFKTNFSERNVADATSVENNLRDIRRIIKEPVHYQKSGHAMKRLFEENFDLSNVGTIYSKIYKECYQEKSLSKGSLILKNSLNIAKNLTLNH